MIKKYNLALLPSVKTDEVIKFARNFTAISETYLLGPKSLPHVTLCHFFAEETEIDDIWVQACKTLPLKKLALEFTQFKCVTFDDRLYWISLLPAKTDLLHKMHAIAIECLAVQPKRSFDPHMTLTNTRDPECQKEVDKYSTFYSVISDIFYLSLGRCDNVGQYTEVIYRCE